MEAWKISEYRKPLILQGARQVGKTYAVLEFGRTHYENVAYFNFETNPKLKDTFEENISPEYLLPMLSHIAGQTIVTEKTLIVFDEVQLSKKNTRFHYKLVKKGGRASEFENAIEWLCLSGIASRVYKVEQVKKPLENYRDIDAFKIYVSDLGLLCAKKDLVANDVFYMVDELNDFKGVYGYT